MEIQDDCILGVQNCVMYRQRWCYVHAAVAVCAGATAVATVNVCTGNVYDLQASALESCNGGRNCHVLSPCRVKWDIPVRTRLCSYSAHRNLKINKINGSVGA